ncbi:MAG: DNA topoisomerase (ATP-hydrolyzing) subunit A, partial [Candidatus Paceibacterota bacterium]
MANKNTPNTSSILQTPISVEMKRSYLNYAMSVIVARALPDIRDGLKPVHRRILYAMHRLGLHHTARFSKSAKVVGEVLGKYHPHGDIPVYDALVRMAQTFSTRYPLVHGQGNFGSMDGDPPAAMRYTEAKLTRIAREMLTDIDKDTIGWRDNFDGSLQEPAFLPAKLPNLLLMGAEGIAVGMATRIPPHNVSEVIDAIIHIIDHAQKIEGDNKVSSPSAAITYVPPTQKQLDPFLDTKKDDKKIPVPQSIAFNVALDDLMKHIKGPDFPTAATIYGIEEIRQAYATGRGKILVRGKIAREEKSRGREAIIIKELPYQVNKAKLVAKVADLVKNKKIEGIADLRDESDKDGVRVVIELKRDAAYNKILNNLYKHTDLQTTYPVNMVALIDEQPQTVSLRVILESYLKHRVDVIKKRSLFELLRSRHRAHILQGLLKALDHIDEIVDLIKKSKTEAQAKEKLVKKFKFSDIQAQAILDMQLKRLTGLERG